MESLAGLASLDGSVTGGTGSINKLHACLSGLSRGSQASYGSLASFHDETSLYNAMAPQSYLLSNYTRQRERKKQARRTAKKKKKAARKRKHQEMGYEYDATQKRRRKNRRKTTIIALPKSSKSKSSKSSKSSKISKKKKTNKTKKIKKSTKLDAAGEAALASSKLSHAPVNPECPAHLISKYGKIYNTFGRVGIYTKQQRTEIMNRYRLKRTNRCWKKTVRYDCRKNLADTRLRIKGRFVRRDSEEAKLYFAKLKADLVSVWVEGV